ncbi:hypothetical protein KSS87_017909 [Heliosperma pusillum]|nr:hypothetical protein KSS87_017909 [Heliosperma pusillum]
MLVDDQVRIGRGAREKFEPHWKKDYVCKSTRIINPVPDVNLPPSVSSTKGGYLHGAKSLTYGVDILGIRWMGILQRISIAYVVAALCEIWLPCRKWERFSIVRSYVWQWCVVGILCAVYTGLLYGLYVPDWHLPKSNSSFSTSNSTTVTEIKCGLRGDLSPACNSAGMIDRFVLGTSHLYAKPAYGNLKECNKTRFGIPESSPSWCHAPFDPEGILGSLTAAVTCIIGLQFGHILVQMQDHKERLHWWSVLSVYCSIIGLLLVALGAPMNKSLYTVSYTLVTSACAGFTFNAFYLLVDVWGYRWLMSILEWMGVHSLGIFILLTSNIAIVVLQGFYLGSPKNNVVQPRRARKHGVVNHGPFDVRDREMGKIKAFLMAPQVF